MCALTPDAKAGQSRIYNFENPFRHFEGKAKTRREKKEKIIFPGEKERRSDIPLHSKPPPIMTVLSLSTQQGMPRVLFKDRPFELDGVLGTYGRRLHDRQTEPDTEHREFSLQILYIPIPSQKLKESTRKNVDGSRTLQYHVHHHAARPVVYN